MENTIEKAGIQLSTNSWHYKLMKLVLGKLSPTPQNMYNFCPYFWLLVFSLLSCWFILPIKGIIKLFSFIIDKTEKFIMNSITIPAAQNWYDNLSDFKAYCIYIYNDKIKESYQNLLISNNEYYYSKSIAIIYKWWETKYKNKAILNNKESNEFIEWRIKMKKEYNEILKQKEIEEKNRKDKNKENIYTIKNNVDNIVNNITNTVGSWTFLIKWTKRVIGLIITICGLISTYYIVNILSKGTLWLVENWNWQIFFISLGSIVLVVLLMFIMHLLGAWFNLINEKGRKLWYINLIYWPLYILIYWPLKIILYYISFKLILINLYKVIISGAILFWHSFMGILGIFGKYGSANYSEYCPGIEWVENKKQ
jgi:hypothetical protein